LGNIEVLLDINAILPFIWGGNQGIPANFTLKNRNLNYMNISVRTIKSFILVGLMAIITSSCNLFKGGGGKPTSYDPGAYSTSTGLAFNEGDTTFKVHEFGGQPDGPNLVYI
jgi:hypothetical protein